MLHFANIGPPLEGEGERLSRNSTKFGVLNGCYLSL